MANIVLITAGGVGKRMGSSIPKQFVKVAGKPIIIYTLEIFENINKIDAIIISCVNDWIDELNNQISKYAITKVTGIVPGGETGQESIYNGLSKISSLYSSNSLVLIHDSVRPLVTEETVIDNIRTAELKGSAVTTVPLTESLIVMQSPCNFEVQPRSCSFIARAPQTFYLRDLVELHSKAKNDNRSDFIDTCSLALAYGMQINIVEGSQENIKITTPSDIFSFKALMQKRESESYLSIL